MFKYSPINSYALRNLQQNQIFFNNPLNFNDPFDTFHPAEVQEMSDDKFVELFCNYTKRKFEKKALLGILKKTISNQDFYDFCNEHIDYIFDFDKENEIKIFKDKTHFLEQLNNIKQSKNEFIENIGGFFSTIKLRLQATIKKTIHEIRQESFSKMGVSCFSKNNLNLLMWSHYADSHQGYCMEFDTNFEPFSKAFEVTYKSEIPNINSDLLFNEAVEAESIKKLLSFKSIDWKHEEELRIFHQESNKSFFYIPRSLKAIYFGIRTNQSDIEIVCSIIKAQNPTVRLYRMKKKELTFGIEPVEFNYNTVIEIQSSLILIIAKLFKNREFTFDQLSNKVINSLTEMQLKAHLEDLISKNVLLRKNKKYLLSR